MVVMHYLIFSFSGARPILVNIFLYSSPNYANIALFALLFLPLVLIKLSKILVPYLDPQYTTIILGVHYEAMG